MFFVILVDVAVSLDVVIRVNTDNLVSDLSEADPAGFSGKMMRIFSKDFQTKLNITSFSFSTNYRQNLELKTYLVTL